MLCYMEMSESEVMYVFVGDNFYILNVFSGFEDLFENFFGDFGV